MRIFFLFAIMLSITLHGSVLCCNFFMSTKHKCAC
jgi:hypothetical protein